MHGRSKIFPEITLFSDKYKNRRTFKFPLHNYTLPVTVKLLETFLEAIL